MTLCEARLWQGRAAEGVSEAFVFGLTYQYTKSNRQTRYIYQSFSFSV